jgi:hypothetical protein
MTRVPLDPSHPLDPRSNRAAPLVQTVRVAGARRAPWSSGPPACVACRGRSAMAGQTTGDNAHPPPWGAGGAWAGGSALPPKMLERQGVSDVPSMDAAPDCCPHHRERARLLGVAGREDRQGVRDGMGRRSLAAAAPMGVRQAARRRAAAARSHVSRPAHLRRRPRLPASRLPQPRPPAPLDACSQRRPRPSLAPMAGHLRSRSRRHDAGSRLRQAERRASMPRVPRGGSTS